LKPYTLLNNISSWPEFVQALESLNNKEKGDTFELLTKLYFKLSPKYQFYDEVWLLIITNSLKSELRDSILFLSSLLFLIGSIQRQYFIRKIECNVFSYFHE
jgi:hypothetical protein